jgi:MinD superfamily P-loop ATPase
VTIATVGAADVVPAGPGCVEVFPDGSGRAELWLEPREAPVTVGVTPLGATELGITVRPLEETETDAAGERAVVALPAGATRPVVASLGDLLVLDTIQPLTVCGLDDG